MEEFDSEDFSSSEEDEDYVPSGKRFRLERLAPPRDPREARLARRAWALVALVAREHGSRASLSAPPLGPETCAGGRLAQPLPAA